MLSVKETRRKRIRYRIRAKNSGTSLRPRLSVFRSNKGIYCQLIDDVQGITLAQANSGEETTKSANKTEQAKQVGKLMAQRAKTLGFSHVIFDRGGYLYHGRVKALAEGAREAGLTF